MLRLIQSKIRITPIKQFCVFNMIKFLRWNLQWSKFWSQWNLVVFFYLMKRSYSFKRLNAQFRFLTILSFWIIQWPGVTIALEKCWLKMSFSFFFADCIENFNLKSFIFYSFSRNFKSLTCFFVHLSDQPNRFFVQFLFISFSIHFPIQLNFTWTYSFRS